MKRVGPVAYRIQLPEEMSDIHPVFHVSQLRKCLRVPEEVVPVETIDLQKDLRYQEVPVKILNTITKRTRNSEVRICRVQWSRHGVEEATWELDHFKWGRYVTSQKYAQINHLLKYYFPKSFSSLSSNHSKILSSLSS